MKTKSSSHPTRRPFLSIWARILLIIAFALPQGFVFAAPAAEAQTTYVWEAYNDCAGTNSIANTTNILGRTGTGTLKNFATGSTLTGVTATFVSSGSPTDGASSGAATDLGTDAYDTFNGKANLVGVVNYGSSSGWYIDLTITGLDPTKTYTFATTANRADATYTTRISRYTISDISAATNASTSGVTVISNESVSFVTGDNTENGYVARWTSIQPGSDGDFKVRADYPSTYQAYGFSVFMLAEELPTGPTITTSVSTLPAFSAPIGEYSAVQSYTVTGSNLTEGITVSAPQDFEVSTVGGGNGFASTASLGATGGTVYVRFKRGTTGTSNGNITHTSAGATQKDVAVSGTAAVYYTLTVNSGSNGSVALDPTGGSYPSGTEITLTATGSGGYIFKEWSGDLTGSDNPATITMDGDKTVTASWMAGACVTSRVSLGSDDVEERVNTGSTNGDVDLDGDTTTKSLQMYRAYGGSTTDLNWWGLRFQNVNVPQGATIASANITFRANATSDATASGMTLWGQAATNPATFTSTDFNVSSRAHTSATASWTVPQWTSGSDYSTPSLAAIVEEIVGQPEWAANNAMVIIGQTTASENRSALSFNSTNGSTLAPLLEICYTQGPNIVTSVSSLPPFSAPIGEYSAEQSYTVIGSNLTEGITVGAPQDFEVSTVGGGSGFASTASLGATGGTVYVRFKRGTAGTSNGNITHTSAGATQKDVAVSGTAAVYYTLTVNSGSNGSVTLNPPGGSYASGTVVTLTAEPHQGYVFDSWSGDLSGDTNPTTITMDGNKSVTANFVVSLCTTVSSTVVASGDDAEESRVPSGGSVTAGTVSISSTDLEMVYDSATGYGRQMVGMRFPNLAIPQGSTIQSAHITWQAKDTDSTALNLTFQAEATDDAAIYTETTNNISSRSVTSASVVWSSVPSWTSGSSYQSADLAPVVQEVVNRSGWATGNALNIIVTGSANAKRNAYAQDGGSGNAWPTLDATYCVVSTGPTITAAGTLTPFATQPGVASDPQTYTVSGSNLTDDILITAPAGFELSEDDSTYSDSLTLEQVSGVVADTTLYVRLYSATQGTLGGNITHTSDGADTKDVAVSGEVAPPNTAPVLDTIGNKSVDELVQLSFTASATDDGLPSGTLTYSLVDGTAGSVPAGATIGSSSGAFTWTPTEVQGPGTYTFDVCVSDGALSDCETITVTVAEVNVAPVLAAIGGKSVQVLQELAFTADATDADLPANTLTYSLADGTAGDVPEGAQITAAGAFTWTPTEAQGPDTYTFDVCVSDGVVSDCETIVVTVTAQATGVTLDGTPSSGTGAANDSSVSFAHTTGSGANGLMLVGVSWNSGSTARAISSVTFKPTGEDALALTEVITQKHGTAANYRYAAIYRLVGPPSGTAGTVTVTFNGTVTNGIVAGAATFAGVNPVAPFGTAVGSYSSSNDTTPTVTLSELVGDELVVDTVFLGGNPPATLTPGSGQTQLGDWNKTVSNTRGAASIEQATGTSVTMSWTAASSSLWVIAAVPLKPAPVGTTYDLTVAVSPAGGGTTLPAAGTHTYPENTVVAVTATPAPGYKFDRWEGACTDSGACQVTMTEDKTVTAYFTELPQYTLTVGTSGNGSVALDPAGGLYYEGTTITLTPVPGPCNTFDGWTGTNADDIIDTDGIYTIEMDEGKSVTANFVPLPAGMACYRVNAGGPTLDMVPDPDFLGLPYSNLSAIPGLTVAGVTNQSSTTEAIDMSGVVAGLPMELFQTTLYRQDDGSMTYDFAVPDGSYEVRLHWAEHATTVDSAGDRVFDVFIEGVEVLPNYDIWAATGGRYIAVTEIVPATVNDGVLNLAITVDVSVAIIRGIEIVPAGDTEPPTLDITGATADGTALGGDLEDGFILQTTNNPIVDHEIQFAANTVASEPLAAQYFGLYLTGSTVTPAVLEAYYTARGVPAPYLAYLVGAANGTNPFVYIKGDGTIAVSLVDAAKHDIQSADVAMTVPDDFPLGTYTVQGVIKDLAGNATTVTLKLVVSGDRVAPELTITGATADGEAMAGDLAAGYILETLGNPLVDHLIQFATGTAASEPLEDTYFGLKLVSSTVTPAELEAYYTARGVPEPYLTYLNAAADGDNPFVYIKGSTVTLVDAAKHDIQSQDVDMTVPDNFPPGTYTVQGAIADPAGNETTVTLILIVTVDASGPVLTVTGATADGEAMGGTLEAGYILPTTNDPALDHLIQFAEDTAADEPLDDEYFGLYLVDSTVTADFLKAYYEWKGVPEPYLAYLKAAADKTNPFVYIKGSTVTLVDAAKHDIQGMDVDMTVPDTFPSGTYTVQGVIEDLAGNETTVTLKLVVQGPLRVVPSAPVVSIVKDGGNARLSWPAVKTDANGNFIGSVIGYYVYYNTAPYFVPGQTAYTYSVIVPAFAYTHYGVAATPGMYFYLVRAVNGDGFSTDSKRVGVFTFPLVAGQ